MTDKEKIELLGEALNNLMQSADNYIEDGSWIDELTLDIENARALLKRIPPARLPQGPESLERRRKKHENETARPLRQYQRQARKDCRWIEREDAETWQHRGAFCQGVSRKR